MDKLQYALDESTREIVRLKLESQTGLALKDENTVLHREVRDMKELLVESCEEMEKCKQEFLRISREKDILTIRLR